MNNQDMVFDLEAELGWWKDRLREKGEVDEDTILELESHLRDEIEQLSSSGLTQEEGFLIGVRRLGNLHALAADFARSRTSELWKTQTQEQPDAASRKEHFREILVLALCVFGSGLAGMLPSAFFSISFMNTWYLRNLFSIFVPFIIMFLFFRSKNTGQRRAYLGPLLLVFSGILTINLYSFAVGAQTFGLTLVHLPFFVWGLSMFSYAGKINPNLDARLNFVRLSGEMFIFSVLILSGVAVLFALTLFLFDSVGINAERVLTRYVLPFLIFASPLVAFWLASKKRSIIENIAPILARIFSPLFVLTLISFLVVLAISGFSSLADRNFLLAADIMLAFVLGMALYLVSSRDPKAGFGFADASGLVMLILAILIDLAALASMFWRISTYGFSPNKIVILIDNLVLLVNLVGLVWTQTGFFCRGKTYKQVLSFQASYIYVLLVWLGSVAYLAPPLFVFR